MTDQPNDLTRKVFRAEIAAVNAHLAETGPSVSADADLRYQVLHALDFAYCNGIGYETPEQLLDAYDAHRPVLPAPADRAAEVLRRTETYLSTIHNVASRHDILAANYACAGCELRDQVSAELRRMANETQQAEPEAPRQWCKCPSCWGWFVEDHPGEDLDELGKDLRWWSGLPEHRDPPAAEAQQEADRA